MIGPSCGAIRGSLLDHPPTPGDLRLMKNFKTALALITAALVALALLATPSSAISLASVSGPPVDNDGANLEMRPPGPGYDTGQVIEILGNFTSATAGQ